MINAHEMSCRLETAEDTDECHVPRVLQRLILDESKHYLGLSSPHYNFEWERRWGMQILSIGRIDPSFRFTVEPYDILYKLRTQPSLDCDRNVLVHFPIMDGPIWLTHRDVMSMLVRAGYPEARFLFKIPYHDESYKDRVNQAILAIMAQSAGHADVDASSLIVSAAFGEKW